MNWYSIAVEGLQEPREGSGESIRSPPPVADQLQQQHHHHHQSSSSNNKTSAAASAAAAGSLTAIAVPSPTTCAFVSSAAASADPVVIVPEALHHWSDHVRQVLHGCVSNSNSSSQNGTGNGAVVVERGSHLIVYVTFADPTAAGTVLINLLSFSKKI